MITISGSTVRVSEDTLAIKTSEGVFAKIILPSTFSLKEEVELGVVVTATGPFSIERGKKGALFLQVHAHYLRVDMKRVL
jgi:hypothetical protein